MVHLGKYFQVRDDYMNLMSDEVRNLLTPSTKYILTYYDTVHKWKGLLRRPRRRKILLPTRSRLAL